MFKDWKHKESNLDGHLGGDDNVSVQYWLDISAHEVGHLPQADIFGSKSTMINNIYHITTSVFEYIKNLSHDTKKEREADKGIHKIRSFTKFTNEKYGVMDKIVTKNK